MEANLTVNILAMTSLIYTILFSHRNIKLDIEAKLNRINNNMMLLTIIMLFLETLNKLLPVTSNTFFITISYISRFIISILVPILPLLAILFFKSSLNIKCNFQKLILPNVLNIIVCILNLKFNFIYTISNTNIYHRSSYFLLPTFFSYIYIIYFFALLLKNRNIIFKQRFFYFSSCIFTLMIFASIQSILKTICIFWPVCAAILIINYIVIQQKALYYNTITLSKNKLALINLLNYYFRKKNMFFLIFIKIENLNYISKNYGYKEEKKAILQTYKLSKNFFIHKGELFHYKNDCFVALIEYNSKMSIDNFIKTISNFFSNSYAYFSTSYTLKYNFSHDLFNNNYSNILDYLYYIDNLIYNLPSENAKN